MAVVPGVGLGLAPLGKVNRCADFSSSGLCAGPEGLIDLRLNGGVFTSGRDGIVTCEEWADQAFGTATSRSAQPEVGILTG